MEAFGVDYSTVATLDTRPDRLARFRAQQFGSVHELVQTRHPGGSMRGCFEAHIAMWKAGEAAGAGPQANFEDDAEWTPIGQNLAKRAAAADAVRQVMAKYPAWDIIGLGGMPSTWEAGVVPSGIPGVIAAKFAEAHAYIISPAFRRRILSSPPYYGHVDVWLSFMAAQSFIVEPELVRQDERCGTDNENPVVAARVHYKRYAYAARTLSGPVPLRHIETLLLIVAAFALGVSMKGPPRARALCCLIFVALLLVYAVDTGVLDAATKPRNVHD